MSETVETIAVPRDVALVLFEMLARSLGAVQPLLPGEDAALLKLEGALEQVLVEPLAPDYRERVDAARQRLATLLPGGHSPKPPVVCFVDVDDTLVRSAGSKRIPMTLSIERVRELHERGVQLYCWSTGGASYALQSATELALSDCFAGYLSKPQIMIDDQPPSEWRAMTCLHPNEATSMSADEIVAAADIARR